MKKEFILVAIDTDNLEENKDIKEIMLIKHYLENNTYKVYELKVNKFVNEKFYLQLLVEGDFSETDFKEQKFEDIKSKILLKKSMVRKCLYNGDCIDFKKFVEKTF